MNIFVTMPQNKTGKSFIDNQARQRLSALGATINESTEQLTHEQLLEIFQTAHIILTGWGHLQITEEMLSNSPLKLIAHTGGSVGSLVTQGAYDKGVKVISGNAYYAESVAEGVLAYMLFALRRMGETSAALAKGEWLTIPTEGLLDQTVGVVSVGAISKRVLEMGKIFRIRFKVFSTRPDSALAEQLQFTYASLDEIFQTCKVVSIHTSASPQTKHMIDRRLMSLLRKDAVFINTSRGRVVDEAALVDLLRQDSFRAVLDVFETEPLPKNHPLIGLPNVALFPHCAGPTTDRHGFITNRLLDDIESFMIGKPMKNEISKETAARMTIGG